jgi:hypothetical protein
MQMIFDEGKEIHKKWQSRIWDLGRLTGQFYCTACRQAWWGTAPDECEHCKAKRVFLRYDEVPLYNPRLRMAGHADGLDGEGSRPEECDAVIEIKSVGINTLRFEAPHLLDQHTYKLNVNGRQRTFIDLDALWDAIRLPFPSHIRQCHFYSYLGAPETEIFLYECKWNQRSKELVVKYREDRIADRLEACRQICWALETGRSIPRCPQDGCADCQRYEQIPEAPKRRILRRPAVAAS